MLGRLLAILFVLGSATGSCVAQSDNAAGNNVAPTPIPSVANAPSSAPKKVWTNDDVPPAKPSVPAADKRGANYRATPSQTADAASVQRIRKGLEKLQAQLDDVNKKLKTYKEFQEGEPVSTAEREINKGINRVPVDQQMAQLQDKKKQLEAQISDLYDEARKKGIDPGQLR